MTKKMIFGRYDYATFLCLCAYACCSVVIPVSLVPLALSLNFPLEDGGMGLGGVLQIARSSSMVFAMLFCGFLAGRWGKARSLGLALLCMSAGILGAAISPFYGLLFCMLVIAGLGEGVIEGLATPVVQDLHPDEPGRYINFSHGFWSVGVLGMVLIAGLLLNLGVNWRWITAGAGIFTLVPALMYLIPSKKSPYPAVRETFRAAEVWRNSVDILKRGRFWLFFAAMFLAGGGEYCLTFWCASFIKLEYNSSMWDAGLGTAVFAGGMIVGRLGSGYLVRQKALKELIVLSALAATAITLTFPFLRSLPVLFMLLFLSGIFIGPFWPSVQSYCATRMTVDNTMLFILLSCAGVPGAGICTMLMGILGDAVGLKMSFFLVPGCFILMTLLIGLDWAEGRHHVMKRLKRRTLLRTE